MIETFILKDKGKSFLSFFPDSLIAYLAETLGYMKKSLYGFEMIYLVAH